MAAQPRRRKPSPLPPEDPGPAWQPASGQPGAGTDGSDGTRTLLRRLQHDPVRAWAELLQRTEQKLRVLLHFRMTPRMRAFFDEDDLLQETWLEAARKIHTFEHRGPGSLQRWMAEILRNKLLHAARSSGRLPAPASGWPAATSAALPGFLEALEKSQPGVSRDARQQEAAARVRLVLERLPEPEREAVLMKLYEGLTGREAAARAGVDESTISVRFKRALQDCARQLRDLEP